jgi:GTPase SAR1 family protein
MPKRDPVDQSLVDFILKTIKSRSTNDLLEYNSRMNITLREMTESGLTADQLNALPIHFILDSVNKGEISKEELTDAGLNEEAILVVEGGSTGEGETETETETPLPPPPPPGPPKTPKPPKSPGPTSVPTPGIGGVNRDDLLRELATGDALIKDIQIGLNRSIIDRNDLYAVNCSTDLIERLLEFDTDADVSFPKQHELPALRRRSTDIYFLGMRGSGKSTMLAAFFSYTNTKGVLRTVPDNVFGNKYKNQLNLGMAAGHLPASTPTEFINFVPVDLKYEGKKHYQSLNFLDMAGEKIRAVANGGMTEFQGYKDYLDNENGKILIFVINFFADNRIKCLDQDQHLQEILALLKKFNILRRTEAVYLILTKADLFPDQNKQKYCDEYLNKYYKNFLQACKEAKVEFRFALKTFPFSIGPSRFGYILEDCDPDTNTNLITYPKLLLQQFEEDCASAGGGLF